MDYPCEPCGQRPDRESTCQHPVHIEAVHQPATHNHESYVGPKECTKEKAEMIGGKVKLTFQQGCCDRKIPTIDIVNKDREGQKENKHQSSVAERLSINLRVCGHTFKVVVLVLSQGSLRRRRCRASSFLRK